MLPRSATRNSMSYVLIVAILAALASLWSCRTQVLLTSDCATNTLLVWIQLTIIYLADVRNSNWAME